MSFWFKYRKKGTAPNSDARIREIVQADGPQQAEEEFKKILIRGVNLCQTLHGPFANSVDAQEAHKRK